MNEIFRTYETLLSEHQKYVRRVSTILKDSKNRLRGTSYSDRKNKPGLRSEEDFFCQFLKFDLGEELLRALFRVEKQFERKYYQLEDVFSQIEFSFDQFIGSQGAAYRLSDQIDDDCERFKARNFQEKFNNFNKELVKTLEELELTPESMAIESSLQLGLKSLRETNPFEAIDESKEPDSIIFIGESSKKNTIANKYENTMISGTRQYSKNTFHGEYRYVEQDRTTRYMSRGFHMRSGAGYQQFENGEEFQGDWLNDSPNIGVWNLPPLVTGEDRGMKIVGYYDVEEHYMLSFQMSQFKDSQDQFREVGEPEGYFLTRFRDFYGDEGSPGTPTNLKYQKFRQVRKFAVQDEQDVDWSQRLCPYEFLNDFTIEARFDGYAFSYLTGLMGMKLPGQQAVKLQHFINLYGRCLLIKRNEFLMNNDFEQKTLIKAEFLNGGYLIGVAQRSKEMGCLCLSGPVVIETPSKQKLSFITLPPKYSFDAKKGSIVSNAPTSFNYDSPVTLGGQYMKGLLDYVGKTELNGFGSLFSDLFAGNVPKASIVIENEKMPQKFHWPTIIPNLFDQDYKVRILTNKQSYGGDWKDYLPEDEGLWSQIPVDKTSSLDQLLRKITDSQRQELVQLQRSSSIMDRDFKFYRQGVILREFDEELLKQIDYLQYLSCRVKEPKKTIRPDAMPEPTPFGRKKPMEDEALIELDITESGLLLTKVKKKRMNSTLAFEDDFIDSRNGYKRFDGGQEKLVLFDEESVGIRNGFSQRLERLINDGIAKANTRRESLIESFETELDQCTKLVTHKETVEIFNNLARSGLFTEEYIQELGGERRFYRGLVGLSRLLTPFHFYDDIVQSKLGKVLTDIEMLQSQLIPQDKIIPVVRSSRLREGDLVKAKNYLDPSKTIVEFLDIRDEEYSEGKLIDRKPVKISLPDLVKVIVESRDMDERNTQNYCRLRNKLSYVAVKINYYNGDSFSGMLFNLNSFHGEGDYCKKGQFVCKGRILSGVFFNFVTSQGYHSPYLGSQFTFYNTLNKKVQEHREIEPIRDLRGLMMSPLLAFLLSIDPRIRAEVQKKNGRTWRMNNYKKEYLEWKRRMDYVKERQSLIQNELTEVGDKLAVTNNELLAQDEVLIQSHLRGKGYIAHQMNLSEEEGGEKTGVLNSNKSLLSNAEAEIAPINSNKTKNTLNSRKAIVYKVSNLPREITSEWIKKMNPDKISQSKKVRIAELVQDNNYSTFRQVYLLFKHKSDAQHPLRVLDLLEIKDQKKRNLLMVAMYNGHIQLCIDLFSSVIRLMRSLPSDPKTAKSTRFNFFSRVHTLMTSLDDDGHNIVDLACVRGFADRDYDLFSHPFIGTRDQDIRKDDFDEIIPVRYHKIMDLIYLEYRPRILETMNDNSVSSSQGLSGRMSPPKMRIKVTEPRDPNRKVSGVERIERELIQENKQDYSHYNNSMVPQSHVPSRPSEAVRISSKKPLKLKKEVSKILQTNQSKPRIRMVELAKSLIQSEASQGLEILFKKKLFSKVFMDIEEYQRQLVIFDWITKDKIKTSINFLKSRTLCLEAYFIFLDILHEFDDQRDYRTLVKQSYEMKRDNPLHFSFYWADIHTTLLLLEKRHEMMFWANKKGRLPPEVIKYCGKNKSKSKAVLISVLNELTRVLNNKIIRAIHLTPSNLLEKSLRKTEAFSEAFSTSLEELKQKKLDEKFDKHRTLLYSKDYVLLSNELCLGFINLIRSNQKDRFDGLFDHEKEITRRSISELEALQRNILDFHKGSFDGYYLENVNKDVRLMVKRVIEWHAYAFKNPFIDPRIFKFLRIDPFSNSFKGTNLLHQLCLRGSHSSLENVLKGLKAWELADPQFNMERVLNKGTSDYMRTPGHLCFVESDASQPNLECLDVLIMNGADIDIPDIRGRTVRQLLSKISPLELPDMRLIESNNQISAKIIEYLQTSILTICKKHNLKFQEGLTEIDFKELFRNSDKELQGSGLDDLKDDILQMVDLLSVPLIKSKIEMAEIMTSLALKHRFEQFSLDSIFDSLKRFNETKTNSTRVDILKNSIYLVVIRSIIQALFRKKVIARGILEMFMSTDFFVRMKHSTGISKYRKIRNREYYDILRDGKSIDFSKILPTSLEEMNSIEPLICVEIKYEIDLEEYLSTKLSKTVIESHEVLNQLDNIKNKYGKYQGGISYEVFEGIKLKTTNWLRCCKKRYFRTYFVLVSASEELINVRASSMNLLTFNMKHNYQTAVQSSGIEKKNLEPLSRIQKISVLMQILKEEFSIAKFVKSKLINSYFPVHDFKEQKKIYSLWSQYKLKIHIYEAFGFSKKQFLTFVSSISMYHGTHHAFFVGFLTHITNSYIWLSFFGIIFLILRLSSSSIDQYLLLLAPLAVGLWSTNAINLWMKKEKRIAHVQDTLRINKLILEPTQRDEFKQTFTIDEITKSVSKADPRNYIFRYTLSSIIIVVRIIIAVAIYLGSRSLIKNPPDAITLPYDVHTYLLLGVEPILAFLVNLAFEYLIPILVLLENNKYEWEQEKSVIVKTVPFAVFTSLFSAVVLSLLDETSISDIRLSTPRSILINTALYGVQSYFYKSVILPGILYAYSRFHCCKYGIFCCSARGDVEELKENILARLYSNPKTKTVFTRYCLDDEFQEFSKQGSDQKIAPLLLKRKKQDRSDESSLQFSEASKLSKIRLYLPRHELEDLKEVVEKRVEGFNTNPLSSKQQLSEESILVYEKFKKSYCKNTVTDLEIQESTHPANKVLHKHLNKIYEKIKKSDPEYLDQFKSQEKAKQASNPLRWNKNYKTVEKLDQDIFYRYTKEITMLEQNEKDKNYTEEILKRNIDSKIRYADYINKRTNILTTTYQPDISSLETSFYQFLLIQFSWVVFFTPIFFEAGLLCYFLNIPVIYMIVVLYSRIARRSISKPRKNTQIWNNMYRIISYMGIIYNTIILLRKPEIIGVSKVIDLSPYTNNREELETFIIFLIENALIMSKVILAMVIYRGSNWMKKRIMNQDFEKQRNEIDKNNILGVLYEQKVEEAKAKLAIHPNHFDKDYKIKQRKLNNAKLVEQFDYRLLGDPEGQNLRFFFKNPEAVGSFDHFMSEKVAKEQNIVSFDYKELRSCFQGKFDLVFSNEF